MISEAFNDTTLDEGVGELEFNTIKDQCVQRLSTKTHNIQRVWIILAHFHNCDCFVCDFRDK